MGEGKDNWNKTKMFRLFNQSGTSNVLHVVREPSARARAVMRMNPDDRKDDWKTIKIKISTSTCFAGTLIQACLRPSGRCSQDLAFLSGFQAKASSSMS